jgi:hypothetical protein
VRPGCFFARPVRSGRVTIRSAYHRIAPPPLPRWVDARFRIRPRRRASRTLSPRYPPTSVNGRWDPSWLGEIWSLVTLRRRKTTSGIRRGGTEEILRDACDRQLPFTRNRQAPASRSVTRTQEACARGFRWVSRFHGAPHASATARAPEGGIVPDEVAIERSASDASVTRPSIVGDFAPALQQDWAETACSARS